MNTIPSTPETPATPLISCVMTAYNAEAYISDAITGIRSQTYPHWHLIIVDDGSTDSTSDICNIHARSDHRIAITTLSRNLGRPYANNVALDLITGDFVAIADADDVSHSDRFAIQLSYLMQHPGISVISSQLRIIDQNGYANGSYLQFPRSSAAIKALFDKGHMGIANPAVLARREVFAKTGYYAIECKRAQDLEYFLRAYKDIEFYTTDEILVDYRRPPSSRSYSAMRRDALYGIYARYSAEVTLSGRTPESFSRFMASYRMPAMTRLLLYRAWARENTVWRLG